MVDAVLVVDRAGQTILANAAYEQLLGAPRAERALADSQDQPLSPDATPRRRAARGEAFEMQFTVSGLDGTRRWYEARGQPIQVVGAEGGVVVIRDISERSVLREQSAFLALVGHELRTPLAGISGNLQLLLRVPEKDGEDPRLRRYADLSLRQVRRLAGLVNDLTDVVRLQEGRFRVEREPLDLVPLVAETVELLQVQTDGQTIRLASTADSLPVEGDARRLQQVLFNLLTNAIKYAPSTDVIDVRLRAVDDRAEVQVQDDGPGIPAADLPHIFSRFYQATRADSQAGGGLGLGLFISREIMAAHDGTLSAASPPGEGAIFTLRLPLRPPPGSP
jgi:two-component system CheB/CheR fusion protein